MDTNKIAKAAKLAKELNVIDLSNGEPPLNHLRRIADWAIIKKYETHIVCACWLSDTIESDLESVLSIIEEEVDEKTSRLVNTITIKEHESWNSYVNRINSSPDGKKVMMLKALDRLAIDPNQYWIDAINKWYK